MLRFVLRRLLGLIFVIVGVTFVTFLMAYLAPTEDPIKALLGQHYTLAGYLQFKHEYGLDQPWPLQYFHYLLNLAQGNLGFSYREIGQPVNSILLPTTIVSLQLGLSAFFLSLFVGVPVGILSAMRKNTTTDTTLMSTMLVLYALPAFVIIPFFQVAMYKLVQNNLPALPVAGWEGGIQYKIAPILILSFTNMGYFARLMRTVMLETLGQDYVRTARSKGLSEQRVIYVHALRNALLPLLSVIGPSLAFLVTGAFVVEFIFNIPGVGSTGINAVNYRDWPVLQGTVVILALAVVVLNLVTDILYGVVDPRIRIA